MLSREIFRLMEYPPPFQNSRKVLELVLLEGYIMHNILLPEIISIPTIIKYPFLLIKRVHCQVIQKRFNGKFLMEFVRLF